MDQNKFVPGISTNNNTEKVDAASTVEEMDFTEEQTAGQIKAHEEDFLQGLIEAAGYAQDETKRIDIARAGKVYFSFTIRPLAEEDYDRCRKKHTKYVRNKAMGMKMPEDTNSVKYRAALIHTATIESDRKKLWDNKELWEILRGKGFQIMNGLDVIECTLKAGEKDKIVECIDSLSGYEDSNLEEVTKN